MNLAFGERKFDEFTYQLTTFDGYSLANHGRFSKLAKLSPNQTFLLHGTPKEYGVLGIIHDFMFGVLI